MNNISAESLRRAASIKDEIESLEGELNALLSGGGAVASHKRKYTKRVQTVSAGDKPKRKGMSAAGRAKISAAAKLRWKKAKEMGKTTL